MHFGDGERRSRYVHKIIREHQIAVTLSPWSAWQDSGGTFKTYATRILRACECHDTLSMAC
jgi:hypothetical protein